ncbi:MAG: HAD-IIA family hydrolase [Actinobacteria bacterium]|nr:HAD-IIA family hydrolase [Actinomycetota bacterium]
MIATQPKALLIDLEGTVRFGGPAIPGAAQALNRLRAAGYTLRFVTNIDSMTPESICRGLTEIGAQGTPAEIFTPLVALRRFVAEHRGCTWYFLLSAELLPEFEGLMRSTNPTVPAGGDTAAHAAAGSAVGAAVGESSTSRPPDYVVIGDFRDRMTYGLLNQAYRHLVAGSRLVALQRQQYFMGPDGRYLDNGAFVQMLEWASGVEALVLGKPSGEFYRLALAELGLGPSAVLVVGDDVAMDVAGARAVGAPSALVRTGKFSHEALEASPVRPDLVLESLAYLPEVLGL